MKVKISIWSGMDVINRKVDVPLGTSVIGMIEEAVDEFRSIYGHAPSDMRLKVR